MAQIISYAQNFEDVILWRALKHIDHGFYIDIGAQHPIVDSVSLLFYEHGWRGMHVEPTQQYSNMLREHRPDERVFQLAIGSQRNNLSFFEFENTGLSTANAEIANQHKTNGFEHQETIVPVITLDELLQQIELREIHWLKVDVEGSEKDVLESWRSSTNLPWIVVVESTHPLSQEKSHQEWEEFLTKKGYQYVYFDGLNRFYISPAHPELIDSFSEPPNIFDNFSLSGSSSHPFCTLINTRIAKIQAKEQKAKFQTQRLEVQNQQLQEQLDAIYSSNSWKITQPLRWLSHQTRLLRQHGFKQRFKDLIKKLLHSILSFVQKHSRLKNLIIRCASIIGLKRQLKKLHAQLSGNIYQKTGSLLAIPQHLTNLSPRARQIHNNLIQAIENNRKSQ